MHGKRELIMPEGMGHQLKAERGETMQIGCEKMEISLGQEGGRHS